MIYKILNTIPIFNGYYIKNQDEDSLYTITNGTDKISVKLEIELFKKRYYSNDFELRIFPEEPWNNEIFNTKAQFIIKAYLSDLSNDPKVEEVVILDIEKLLNSGYQIIFRPLSYKLENHYEVKGKILFLNYVENKKDNYCFGLFTTDLNKIIPDVIRDYSFNGIKKKDMQSLLIREREEAYIEEANKLEILKGYKFEEFADSYEDKVSKVDAIYTNIATGEPLRVQFKTRYRKASCFNDVAVRCYSSGGHELDNSRADLIIEFIIDTDDAMFDFENKKVLQVKIIDLRKYRNTRYRFFKGKYFCHKGYSVNGRVVYLNTQNNGTMLILPESLNEIIPGFYTKIDCKEN